MTAKCKTCETAPKPPGRSSRFVVRVEYETQDGRLAWADSVRMTELAARGLRHELTQHGYSGRRTMLVEVRPLLARVPGTRKKLLLGAVT